MKVYYRYILKTQAMIKELHAVLTNAKGNLSGSDRITSSGKEMVEYCSK